MKFFPVLHQAYDVHVSDHFVIRGSTALLQCHTPPAVRPYVKVMLWLRDDGVSIGSPGTIGKNSLSKILTNKHVLFFEKKEFVYKIILKHMCYKLICIGLNDFMFTISGKEERGHS